MCSLVPQTVKEITIDTLDFNILKKLQLNGRIKHTELARELGVPQSTLLERVRRLEEGQYILGYQANLNYEKLGLTVQAYIAVSLKQHEKTIIEETEQIIRETPYIQACHHLTGRYDYLLQVAANDLQHLGEIVKSEIASFPGYGTSETFVIFSEIKSAGSWPVAENSGIVAHNTNSDLLK